MESAVSEKLKMFRFILDKLLYAARVCAETRPRLHRDSATSAPGLTSRRCAKIQMPGEQVDMQGRQVCV